jgi:hypothetical protein
VRRRFSGGWLVLVIALALLVAGVGAYLAIRPGRLNAIPGQCVGGEGNVVAVVECSTAGSYRVVGVVELDAKPSSTMNPCNGRYRVTAYFWQANPDGSGQVFCLGPQ